MTIPTVQSTRRARRFQDHRRAAAARVITAMEQCGLTLNLMFTKHGSAFTLSDGSVVAPEIALAVVNDVRVIGCGDGLFGGGLCQTWRFVEL
jgi:hypothetical protein